MAMQFNPHTAFLRGMDLGSPTTSQGGINNLLQMQQNTLNGLTDTIGNIGKTSRTNTVNDLIARGGLEGLNEAQTQAKIAETAKGTLTPEGQAQVDKLLNIVGKQDEQKFRTGERIAGQDYSTSERLGRQGFDTNERVAGEGFKSGESSKEREQRLMLEKMGITSNEKIAGQRDSTTRRGQDLEHQDAIENRNLKKLLETDKGEKKDDKLTGEIGKLWEDSTGKGKLALEQMYKTGNLQAVPIVKTDENGKPYQNGTRLMYNGKETSVSELKKYLGLHDSNTKIK